MPRPIVALAQRPALALLIVPFLLLACGEPLLEARPPSPGAPHFTILTYNIHLGAAREPRTLDAIAQLNADIACLQEVTPSAEAWLRENLAEQYPHQLFKARNGAGGLAVLSRFPMAGGELRAARETWHPSWHLEAFTPAGRLHLVNVHLRSVFGAEPNIVSSYFNTGEDHLDELHALSDWRDDGVPTIVLGDFNESGEGDAVGFLEQRGFLDVLPAFHPGQPTWHFRSPADQLEEALDHILVDAELVPLDAWVVRQGQSDHLPVLAHFEPRSF